MNFFQMFCLSRQYSAFVSSIFKFAVCSLAYLTSYISLQFVKCFLLFILLLSILLFVDYKRTYFKLSLLFISNWSGMHLSSSCYSTLCLRVQFKCVYNFNFLTCFWLRSMVSLSFALSPLLCPWIWFLQSPLSMFAGTWVQDCGAGPPTSESGSVSFFSFKTKTEFLGSVTEDSLLVKICE